MKRWKQVCSTMLAGTMLIQTPVGAAPVPEAEQEEKSPWVSDWKPEDGTTTGDAYQIYPVPQKIEYPSKTEFDMDKNVGVVSGEKVDKATNDYLNEVLEDFDRTPKKEKKAGDGSDIIIGVKGSGDEADKYFADKKLDEKLFEQSGGYALSADGEDIIILGKDTEAAFYGVATLKMMFSSFNGEKFYPVEIQDYASIDARGYIEGFYGSWTHEQRKSLMEFTRDVKMNLYVYASKTDAYHTSKWAELYPDDILNQFKELVALQEKNKTEFSWAVHIGDMLRGLQDNQEEEYQARKKKLMAKFDQLYDIGVRRFCILNDDFGAGSPELVVRLVNELNEEYIKAKGCKPIIYCPQGYNVAWSQGASGQKELETLKKFDEDVLIFWTGQDVNSPFTQESITYAKEKTGHSPVFWVNYPCNEHAKSGIFLGSSAHYVRDNITGLAGAVSNPIHFAEADKVALFQLASYFWNVNDYSQHTEEVWEQCFKYLEPEVYDAYLTIARNVSNCPGSGRVPKGFEESLYLAETLDTIQKAVQGNTFTADMQEVKNLKAEFAHIRDAIKTFTENCTNKALVQELTNPGNREGGEGWLQALENVVKAGEYILQAQEEMAKAEPDMGVVWQNFSDASAEMDAYNKRTYEFPAGGTQSVKAGSRRLVPFVNACMEDVKAVVDELLATGNAETPADRIYTNVSKYAKTPLTIDEKEYGVRNVKVTLEKNQYIGIKTKEIAEISKVILEGSDVSGLTLEYALYGDDWKEVEPGDLQENLEARYLRLINKGEKPVTATVNKLAAVIENRAVSMSVKGTNIKELQSGSWDEMFDGNAETFALTKGAQKTGDYITVDLGRTQAINDITFWTADGDQKIYDAKVSVSKNNKDFEKVATWNSESGTVNPPRREYKADAKGKEGRYVRLEVTANNNNPLKIFEVEVNKGQKAPGTISPDFALTSDKKADKKALTDKNLATVFQISQTDDKSYLEYRITDNVNLDSFTVLQAGSCEAKVTLKTADGKTKDLGKLTKTTQEFKGWEENVHAVRFEFPKGKDVKLNEIILKYGENPSGDVGQAVENIPVDPGVEDSKETVNLALNQPVEVSGIETNNVKPESAVDGNEDTKWDSAALKGSGAKSPQWIIVDLGTYTNMISEIKMSYFNKVYPTDYDVQVSNDKENWVTVKTITKQNNGPVNPVDTVKEELTQPVAARYVRILFRSINANAAGNCIGLKELTVNGVRRHVPVSYTSVAELENVNAEVNAENVALPALVETTVKAGEEKEQPLKVIPTWDTEKIDTSKPADITVTGTLPINYSLVNPEALEAQIHVIIGEGGTEPENPERTNLALNQKVEVSDVETDFDGSKTDYVGEYAVDGKADTRWSSGPLNSKLGLGGEPKDQYIVVDLGAGKNTIDEMKVSYFKKVWPTNYTVEVSADKNTWETVKTIEKNSSNDLNVVDDFKLEKAKNARYVRLSFPKDGLNTNAAGSSVSITELEVYGTKEDITIDTGVLEEKIASAKELIKNAEAEPNKYDSATVEVLKEALEVAENTLKNPESQEQVNKAAEELATAEAGLKELDLDALNVALKEAEEILAAESDYTPETYKVFKAAYEEAKALLGKPMTQQQAEEAKAKLETAQEQLEKVEIVENEGWKETENGWEYYENGQKVIGWLYTGNHWYYMDDNGIMVTGWAAVDGHWYYMDQWGAMCTGWVSVDGHWYYMDQWGAMCTGWVSVDGHWYYMDQWGAMQTGWVLVGDTWYYMNNSGAMQTGWVLVGDTWYYMNNS
ncbi:MAG: beta-N-acetylglucosaminidase domain-containing protein, partial [Blautia sp.]|nr:beta-N-acetylglucosaminidase domain-containing protein [Blautia sp.]